MSLVTLDEIKKSQKLLSKSHLIFKTPLLKNVQLYSTYFKDFDHLSFKLESMQNQGSFKIRGIVNLLEKNEKKIKSQKGLVSMSAGNFGRSFTYCADQLKVPAVIVMPDNVPNDRVDTCKKNNATVFLQPRKDLMKKVNELTIEKNYLFVHPFDDKDLIEGYGSIGLEILSEFDEKNTPDLVLVGCGGGGLVSGISAAIKLSQLEKNKKPKTKIIGVEPKGASKMKQSLQEKKPVTLAKIETFVNGLSAPFAGAVCFEHVKSYVDDILLVDDHYVKLAMKILYTDYKLVIESAGAAVLGAILQGLIDTKVYKNVVCVLSGGNCSAFEMNEILKSI